MMDGSGLMAGVTIWLIKKPFDKEAGFSSPEDALQDLSIGKGKYVANVVLDEGRWASRQDMDQP